jgi:DNA uptake protein ComE-like DNA-binding protein
MKENIFYIIVGGIILVFGFILLKQENEHEVPTIIINSAETSSITTQTTKETRKSTEKNTKSTTGKTTSKKENTTKTSKSVTAKTSPEEQPNFPVLNINTATPEDFTAYGLTIEQGQEIVDLRVNLDGFRNTRELLLVIPKNTLQKFIDYLVCE